MNGQEHEVDLGSAPTVAALVSAMVPQGRPCAVEVNRAIVPMAKRPEVPLREGDEVEIVTFVGGG